MRTDVSTTVEQIYDDVVRRNPAEPEFRMPWQDEAVHAQRLV